MNLINMTMEAKSKEDLEAILKTEEWTKADYLTKGFTAQIMIIQSNSFRIDKLEERVAKLEQLNT